MKTIITQDVISMVAEGIKNDKGKLTPFEHDGYVNIAVGMVNIVATEKDLYLRLSDGLSSRYLADWNKDVGKLLSRTLKKKKFSLLYLYKTDAYEALLRRMEDEEYYSLKDQGFDHVMIGDFNYTIIRVIQPGGSFTLCDSKSFDPEEYIPEDRNEPEEEEPAYEEGPQDLPESLSLFDD